MSAQAITTVPRLMFGANESSIDHVVLLLRKVENLAVDVKHFLLFILVQHKVGCEKDVRCDYADSGSRISVQSLVLDRRDQGLSP